MKENQLDSEKIIIGDILNDLEAKKSTNDFLPYVFNILNPYDFVSIKNREIFVYIKNQLANKASLSLEKITADLNLKNEFSDIDLNIYLKECIDLYNNKDANFIDYIEFIKKQSALNKILPAIKELAKEYKDKKLFSSYTFLNSIAIDIQRKMSFDTSIEFKSSNEAITFLIEKLSDNNCVAKNLSKKLDNSRKIKTGLSELDSKIGGLQKGCLSLISGRPDIGKTILSLVIALNVAKSGTPVGIFSLEASSENSMIRLLSNVSGISTEEITNMPFLKLSHLSSFSNTNKIKWDDSKIESITKASEIISNCPIYIYDNYFCSIERIEEKTRKLKLAFPNLGVIIIDYLSLLELNSQYKDFPREANRNDILLRLKHLAIELDISIIVISQLSRAVSYRANGKPYLLDLKELGINESYIDQAYFLRRIDNYKHKATNTLFSVFYRPTPFDMGNEYEGSKYIDSILELDLVKNKFGKTATFNFNFNKETNQINIISNKNNVN